MKERKTGERAIAMIEVEWSPWGWVRPPRNASRPLDEGVLGVVPIGVIDFESREKIPVNEHLMQVEFLLSRVNRLEESLAFLKGRVGLNLPEWALDAIGDLGRVEWGTSEKQTIDEHLDDLKENIRLTNEAEDLLPEDTSVMHGLYVEGTGLTACLVGTSVNSKRRAMLMTGIWNYYVDMAQNFELRKKVEFDRTPEEPLRHG